MWDTDIVIVAFESILSLRELDKLSYPSVGYTYMYSCGVSTTLWFFIFFIFFYYGFTWADPVNEEIPNSTQANFKGFPICYHMREIQVY